MSQSTQTASASFPILGILGVVFITLKLLGVIAWSWWWVLAPFWVPAAIALVIGLVVFIAILSAQRGGRNPFN